MSALWPFDLGKPIDPLDTFRWSVAMSANTRNGRVPTLEEARSYAREQMQDGPPEPITNYADRRGV